MPKAAATEASKITRLVILIRSIFCADATQRHATAAPPSSVMNARRLMPGMGSLPVAAADHISWNRRAQAV
jgi:hypothetical protein